MKGSFEEGPPYGSYGSTLSVRRNTTPVDDEAIAIHTSGLTKRISTAVLAVDDLDLRVYEGEIFGFLGPNGAGKSTTIDVIMDYVRPSAGSASSSCSPGSPSRYSSAISASVEPT